MRSPGRETPMSLPLGKNNILFFRGIKAEYQPKEGGQQCLIGKTQGLRLEFGGGKGGAGKSVGGGLGWIAVMGSMVFGSRGGRWERRMGENRGACAQHTLRRGMVTRAWGGAYKLCDLGGGERVGSARNGVGVGGKGEEGRDTMCVVSCTKARWDRAERKSKRRREQQNGKKIKKDSKQVYKGENGCPVSRAKRIQKNLISGISKGERRRFEL